jgi:hypothetical protein
MVVFKKPAITYDSPENPTCNKYIFKNRMVVKALAILEST